MVAYSRFSGQGTFSEDKKLWDPTKTLGITNTDPGYERNTCIGYAPSKGRRCRNPMANEWLLSQILEDIAYIPADDSPAIMSRLGAVAGAALCNRFHQNQTGSVMAQWMRKIQQLPTKVKPSPTQHAHSSNEQKYSQQDQTIRDLKEQLRKMSELLAKGEERLNNRENQGPGYERQQKKAAKDQKEEKEVEEEKEAESRRRRSQTEKERLEKEKKQRDAEERLKKERLEKERLEKERLEKERLEKERREREEEERLEKEKKEKEEKKQRDQANNERIRQKAQKLREQREREKLERERKEREEWDQSWSSYQKKWVRFRASAPTDEDFRNAIPWPVKSGLRCDVKSSTVKEFLEMAAPKDADMAKLMRKECLKWHPDKICRIFPASRFVESDRMIFDMICRVVTELLNKSGGK